MSYFTNEQVREDIRRHAAGEYPKECCGVVVHVLGKDQYFPCRNLATTPEEEFIMCPQDMTDAMDLGEVMAIVHSHPDATSRPSDYDLAFIERLYASERLLDEEAVPTAWVILSWPEGDFREVLPKGSVPLQGRKFVHGLHDCWQVCADYYNRLYGWTFPDFERKDAWWEDKNSESHYESKFADQGFYKVPLESIQEGDLVVMQIGRSLFPNHAGIYLGSTPILPDEEVNVFGHGPFILHHMYNRLSKIEVYGGQWLERTRFILRRNKQWKANL